MSAITLTQDQQAAYDAVESFVQDPLQDRHIISGYAGVGKTTLVDTIINNLERMLAGQYNDIASLVWEPVLTATTNKAAEALQASTGRPVQTVQKFLGLIVRKDWDNGGKSYLARGRRSTYQTNKIVFVDEASYATQELMDYIDELCNGCKVIYIGDAAQLAAPKTVTTPVFSKGYPGSALTEVVRQAKGNPIIELATGFRNIVRGEQSWFPIVIDGEHIQHMSGTEYEQALMAEFDRPDWHFKDSKVLAYTNARVIEYNRALSNQIDGKLEIEVGDYVVNNNYVKLDRPSGEPSSISTDAIVHVTAMTPSSYYGVQGFDVTLDDYHLAFMPSQRTDVKELLKLKKSEEDFESMEIISNWVDLRATYACTVNKSQGSTFKKVFIDLTDIGKCRNYSTMARLLYVAVSRASHQLILTGDLVAQQQAA
jgi:exodeoxyribonuclease V